MVRALTSLGRFVEAAGNMMFYLIVVLIPAFPLLVWINDKLSGRTGVLWVLVAFLFAIVLPTAMQIFAESAMTVVQRIREGRLLGSVFRPLRSVSAALAVFGVFKLEYALVYDLPKPEDGGWMEWVWRFLTAF